RILARFMFFGYSVFQKVSRLSGGERMRLRLAQLMYQDVNVLILDEPTNQLDIESREVLEEALEDFQGTLLAVSHDRYFLNKLFNKIYWIENKKIHGFDGDYTWAREKMAALRESALKINVSDKKETVIQKEKTMMEGSTDNKRIEDELCSLEEKIITVDEKLFHEKDLELLQQLSREKEKMEEKWEELCDTLDDAEG